MMGISYGGISQLFTAARQPPSLAAISPLSVLDATQTTLYPGGMLNTGFAVDWAKERIHDAKPASRDGGPALGVQADPGGRRDLQGQPGAARRGGRPAQEDPRQPPLQAEGRRPARARDLRQEDQRADLRRLPVHRRADRRALPDAGAAFTGTERKWFTFTNGTHVDSLDPETFNRWYDFLKLYVAQEAPITGSAAIRGAAPVIYQDAMGVSGVTLPRDEIQEQPTYQDGARRLRAASAGARPVRQRRGRRRRSAVPGLRALVRELPGAGHQGPLVLPRQGRRAERQQARAAPAGPLPLGRPRHAADELLGRHRQRRPLDRDPGLQVGPAPGGHGRVLREAPLGSNTTVLGGGARASGSARRAERRPAGDDQRGPARRQGDVRAERLGARQRAQARRADEHAARARAEPAQARRQAAAAQALRQGRRSRSTTRATPTGPARASASRSARPTATSRSGRSARRCRRAPRRSRSRTRASGRRGSCSRSCRGRGAHRLPPCPGLRGEPCRDYRPIVNRKG